MTLNTAPDGHELALAPLDEKPIMFAAHPPAT
jgi:hypothetical protein